ncbi:MAG: hypothetical protein ACOYXW_08605 [Actinomycetota bacterium]
MDRARATLLADLLSTTPLVDGARRLAVALRRPGAGPGSLLLVGTPDHEPWHLTAHLDEEARYAGLPDLSPTLVRWQVPDGAPPHLAVDLQRLEATRRGETVFVVSPDAAPEQLLERADDARRRGATLLSLDGGDDELAGIVHERMVVSPGGLALPAGVVEPSFDVAQHLVSAAAGETETVRRGWRARLESVLERVSGPAPRR